MPVTFDPQKSERNRQLRGLPFELAEDFDFSTAILRQDMRQAYPEARYQALGMLGDMVGFLVFTPTGDGYRVMSLRKASRKERAEWHARQSPI